MYVIHKLVINWKLEPLLGSLS